MKPESDRSGVWRAIPKEPRFIDRLFEVALALLGLVVIVALIGLWAWLIARGSS